jgi:hypothetical protein
VGGPPLPAMLPACDALPALVTPLPCCCCSACPQPSAPAPSATASPPAPVPGPALVRTVSPGPKHRYRGSTFNPPYTDMPGWHPTSKISPMPFYIPVKSLAENTPRLLFPPKFYNQNSGLESGPSWAIPGLFMDTPHLPPGPRLIVASWPPWCL